MLDVLVVVLQLFCFKLLYMYINFQYLWFGDVSMMTVADDFMAVSMFGALVDCLKE